MLIVGSHSGNIQTNHTDCGNKRFIQLAWVITLEHGLKHELVSVTRASRMAWGRDAGVEDTVF